jgi:hypothetical protein
MRGNVTAQECPKSFVTPESIERVEHFFASKYFGGRTTDDVGAREADAFLVLEQEWTTEKTNAQQ